MGNAAKKIIIRYRSYITIVIVWLIFCIPYLSGKSVPFPSQYLVTFFPPWSAQYQGPVKNAAMPDVISQIYPWKRLTIDSWKNGEIPLWNPYSFSGTHLAANYQSAVFSPINLLFSVFSFDIAWSIMILFQPLLAGIFMVMFLKALGLSDSACITGGIAFMFSGFMVVWMSYGTLGYAALFLPLALYAIERENRQAAFINRIILSLSLTLSFLSGHFQISIYVMSAVTGYIIYRSFHTMKTMIILASYAILGLGIAAPQLILAFDAFRESVRSDSFVKGEIIPWQYLPTFISPDFYGNPVTRNDWFGHYAEWASYIGVVPLYLAIRSLISKMNGKKVFFAVLALSAFLFAYPTPFSDLLYLLKIPVLGTSAASRIIMITSFALAVLAAYGMTQLNEDLDKRRSAVTKRSMIIMAVIYTLIWLILLLFKPYSPERINIAVRNLILPGILLVSAYAFITAGHFFRTIRYIVVGGLIIITGFDLLRFTSKWMPADSREYMYPVTKMTDYLVRNAGNTRILGNLGGEFCVRYKLQCIEGYDAMYRARYAEFINSASDGNLTAGGRSVVLFDKNGKYSGNMINLLVSDILSTG